MSWSIPARAVLAALAIHTLWGGNPVAMKLGLEAFPPVWPPHLGWGYASKGAGSVKVFIGTP